MNGEINLASLGGGIALEKFEEEMTRVVDNILDPNTDPVAKREVIIKVTIKPANDRSFGNIDIAAHSKLAPAVCFTTRGFFGRDKKGQAHAFEDNPRQVTLDDFIQQQGDKVTPLQQQQQEERKAQ